MENLKSERGKEMAKNNVVKEKKSVVTEEKAVKKNVTLTSDQNQAWDIFRDTQISILLAEALSKPDAPIVKTILRYGIARCVDQKHNTADRKLRACEAGKFLSLEALFSKVRSGSKDELASMAVDLLIEASLVDKAKAKAIMDTARKANTIAGWEKAIAEFEDILGQWQKKDARIYSSAGYRLVTYPQAFLGG